MSHADFDKERLRSVYGDWPACLLCGVNANDWHHCMGRGYVYGLRKGDAAIMSSVYNAAPLCRKCHERGGINQPNTRRDLLMQATARCDEAVMKEKIVLNENDTTFRTEIAFPFMCKQ
jgi:hypothetical protein